MCFNLFIQSFYKVKPHKRFMMHYFSVFDILAAAIEAIKVYHCRTARNGKSRYHIIKTSKSYAISHLSGKTL